MGIRLLHARVIAAVGPARWRESQPVAIAARGLPSRPRKRVDKAAERPIRQHAPAYLDERVYLACLTVRGVKLRARHGSKAPGSAKGWPAYSGVVSIAHVSGSNETRKVRV